MIGAMSAAQHQGGKRIAMAGKAQFVEFEQGEIGGFAGFDAAHGLVHAEFAGKQQAFLDFVLAHYVREGVQELDQEKLAPLLKLRYHDSLADALADLGDATGIGLLFAGFQKYLYQPAGAA